MDSDQPVPPPPGSDAPELLELAPSKAPPGTGGSGGRRTPSGPVMAEIGIVAVVVALIVGYIWVLPNFSGSASPTAGPSASSTLIALGSPGSPAPSGSAPAASASNGPNPRPTSTTVPGGPIGHAGGIVILGNDGSVAVIDAATSRESVLATAERGQYLFPAWSPDGKRIAAIRIGSPDTEIEVFDAARAEAGEPLPPVVVLRSPEIGPFYLSWSPDGKNISYLANEPTGLSLRLVPADGSAPIDGSATGSRIKTGNPLYYDWIDSSRILAHIGTGADAFLGEVTIDGSQARPPIEGPGDFRSATVSDDARLFGYVRAGSGNKSDVVLAARDGSSEHTMPVFGSAAVSLDPAGTRIASIGPVEPPPATYSFPFGPLRLLDAAGTARTLLPGQVVGFWWSPDGKTIAALRVQPVAGAKSPASPSPASSAEPEQIVSPAPSDAAAGAASGAPGSSPASGASPPPSGVATPVPSPSEPPTEVRLVFVDVASGKITSQPVVAPGDLFVSQFLTYFDQYARSHQLWAPDSSSFLLPLASGAGSTVVELLPRNGGPGRAIDGAIGFWSP